MQECPPRPMTARRDHRGPRILVSGLSEDQLTNAIADAFRECGSHSKVVKVDEYLEAHRRGVFSALCKARSPQARYSLYNRLRPLPRLADGHYPAVSIGAIAVVSAVNPTSVTDADVRWRRPKGESDPLWWQPLLAEVPELVDVRVRVGRDFGTVIAVSRSPVERDSLTSFGTQSAAIGGKEVVA